ncbi:tail fiber [Synechococcus phage ACG-2014f]|uniref:Tail fiber n=1 Tax=Synechococcus phage ACG-2014f TaxID=1493511 RepID=A0A0E3FQP2_9CAUD|nr:tail fiber [Synechococcus phage ACG-2014f]AIX31579.1 tail fiber [Synechococcus phage ACG-2014f]AIX31868.1 tail fiber [Synechococcus phage ACG-2014f]
MAFKINGVVRIDNSGNGFLGIVTATDANITGVLTATEVDAKVSSKAITEQTDGTVDDVTGADELLLLDAETGGLLRVSIDEFVQGSGIGTLVTDFDNLTVTGITTVATLKGIGSNNISVGSTLSFADGTEIIMGDSGDFSIHHDGDHTYLDETGQGNLKLRTNNFRVTNIAETKPAITAQVTSGVELYFDGNKKIETTNTGVLVSGMLTADRLRSGDIAARNVITLGITTIQDHLEVNDSTGSGTEYNLNVKTNGSSTFGVLGNGNILLGNSSGAPFIATNDHHATSKKYVDDAIDDSVSYIGASAWARTASSGTLISGMNFSVARQSNGVYNYTFTTPMSNADYSIVAQLSEAGTGTINGTVRTDNISTTGFKLVISNFADQSVDQGHSVVVHSATAIAPPSGVGADAWGTFSGTTGDLQAGMNISSTTRTALGEYDVEFITEMPSDSEYAVTAVSNASQAKFINIRNKSTSGFKVVTRDGSGNISDGAVSFAVHASSTVTPTYTWTRDGTTLKPANDGDMVEVSGISFGDRNIQGVSSIGLTSSGGFSTNSGHITFEASSGGAENNIYYKIKGANAIHQWEGSNGKTLARLNDSGAFTLGGTLASSPSISMNADGSSSFDGQLTIISDNRSGFSFVTNSVGGNNSYNVGQTATQASFYLVQAGNGLGVYLPKDGTAWSPVSSDEAVKDIVPMTVDNSWDVIRDVELFNYYYKVNDEQHRATHPPYFGPMAKRLGDQDPDLLIDNDDACTYNAGLLEMKALSALSTALNRIEALEAKVQSLEEGVTPD